jgi:cytosine permease
VLGILMLFLNLWTTQDNPICNLSAVGCTALGTGRRRQVRIVGALIGTALALMRIDLHLIAFLLLIGTFIPPIGGVIMADDFDRHRGLYPKIATGEIAPVNLAGSAGYGSGCLVAYLSPGIPPVNGIIAAIVGYVAADLVLAR